MWTKESGLTQKQVKKIYSTRKNTAGAGRRRKNRKKKDDNSAKQTRESLQRKRIRKKEVCDIKKKWIGTTG